MTKSIAELLDHVTVDPWRKKVGFSPEVNDAQSVLFDDSVSENVRVAALANWIQRHQPCLFGRIAAARKFLSYCILSEQDLRNSDEQIRDKIQSARTAWTREGYYGRKSGFVILGISRDLAYSIPDDTTKQIALRLANLFLLKDVASDEAFLDEIFLEKPGPRNTTWVWDVGINYFSAQGDGRWWQDHRIPGGLAFSMNSVGHMVKSNILARAMEEMGTDLGAPDEGWEQSSIDSLGKALIFAMRTISRASVTQSGRATELLPDGGDARNVKCPVELPPDLVGRDYCQYRGHYHTDYTIPSEYFRPDVIRPDGLHPHILDFTYLFDGGIDNPEFIRMARGRPIRADDDESGESRRSSKMWPQEIQLTDSERLRKAIGI